MNSLYKVVNISKQAVYQYGRRQRSFDQKVAQLVLEADLLRAEHPGCGVEKMYYTLKPDFIGRDRFIALFMSLGYRVKHHKNYRRTTYATSHYYPNLIKGMDITAPSQVWQSDITYIDVNGKFYYAVFIIDVFTRKIVGYQVSDHLRANANVVALKKAFKVSHPPMIHHSDRGSQYIYRKYLDMLTANHCRVSMGATAQENAFAERINKTIKEEYLQYWKPKNLQQLKTMVKKAVSHYNEKRLHNHLKRNTPNKVEGQLKKGDNNEYLNFTIFNHE